MLEFNATARRATPLLSVTSQSCDAAHEPEATRMILAELQLSQIEIPADVRRKARSPQVELSRAGAPPEGAVWISCCYATPHLDKGKGWDDLLFLTVSVLSQHVAGDALSEQPQMAVDKGCLFVIDPMVTHWLFDKDSWERKAARSWVGLQWEVKRSQAAQKAGELVHQFNGRWLPTNDDRYKGWRRHR